VECIAYRSLPCAQQAHAADECIRRPEGNKSAMRPLAKLLWTLVTVVCCCYAEKKEKPTVAPLSDVERAEQEEASFETTVTGRPEPTVEW